MFKFSALPLFPAYATLADKLGWWAVRCFCVLVMGFLLALEWLRGRRR